MRDVLVLAVNLAKNCGYAVFPVGEDKQPTLKGWPERASTDPDAIAAMWRERPGPLIGIATGEVSSIDVLDVDIKHDAALWWWRDNHHRLLPVRVFESRSGGLHIYFQHASGIRNTQGKVCAGVDTRGSGGYCIYWFAAGFRCLDCSPPQQWPVWLLKELTRKPPAPPPINAAIPTERAIAGIVRRLESAQEGSRNAVLFWCACRLAERAMHQGDIEALLLPAAYAVGLSELEARRTIASARSGRAAA